jgi:hypothetical protein
LLNVITIVTLMLKRWWCGGVRTEVQPLRYVAWGETRLVRFRGVCWWPIQAGQLWLYGRFSHAHEPEVGRRPRSVLTFS